MTRIWKQCALAGVLCALTGPAAAALLTWNVQASGPNGATASGFLQFDAQAQTLAQAVGDFALTFTSGGDPLFLDIVFTPSNTDVLSFTPQGKLTLQTRQPSATIDRFISIEPVAPDVLGDAGGTAAIAIDDARIQASQFPTNRIRSFTGIASTSAIEPIPEADSIFFLLAGGALLALTRRRWR